MSEEEIANLENQLLKLQLDFNRKTTEITNQLKKIRRRESKKRAQVAERTTEQQEVFEDAQEELGSASVSLNTHSTLTENTHRPLQIGDWVKVINNYRPSQFGAVGKIYKFNKLRDRVYFRTLQGENIEQAPGNVTRVRDPTTNTR